MRSWKLRLAFVLSGLVAVASGVAVHVSVQEAEAAYTPVPAQAISTMEKYLIRAQKTAALSSDVAYQWEDFFQVPGPAAATGGWSGVLGGTGSISAITSGERHSWRFITGALAASTAQIRNNGNQVITSSSTDKWYLATRLRVNTAITAQTMAYVGLWDNGAANSVALGVVGNLSDTNFIVQHSGLETGGTVNLGVAVDTNFHTLEAWAAGTTQVCGRIDAGTPVCGTQTAAGTNMGPVVVVRNGTDAVTRHMSVDWILLAAGRTP